MIATDTLFLLLVLTLTVWFICGLATLAWGKRLARGGDWLAAIPALPWLAFCGVGLVELADERFSPKAMLKGWIGVRDDAGAITIGLLQDPLGLVLSLLAGVLIAIYLLDRGLYAKEKAPERSYAALAISGAGVGLAVIAATPWLALFGLTISLFGGFLCLGSRWESDEEAPLSGRFAWERTWGLLVALLGLCLLASSRAAITFVKGTAFVPYAGPPMTDRLGAILLVAGLFLQTGVFPFLGTMLEKSSALIPIRLLTTKVFPSWCAFILLARFEDELRQLGVFPLVGWVSFASAALALASGLVQEGWKGRLLIAVSAGFNLAVGVLAFAGPRSGLAFLLTSSLGGLAMASAGNELDAPDRKKDAEPKPAPWSRVGSGFGASALSGMVGFISAAGALQLGLKYYEELQVLVAFVVVLLLLGVLVWSTHWRVLRLPAGQPLRVVPAALPFVLSLLCLGAVWGGSATGGLFLNGEDQFGQSLLELFWPGASGTNPANEAAAFVPVLAVIAVSGFLGLLIGFSTTGRKVDSWSRLRESAPRFAGFLGSGYGLDRGVDHLKKRVVHLANGAEWFFSTGLWGEWLPKGFGLLMRKSGSLAARADERITTGLAVGLRATVDAPAKVLQAVQSGDVRWYLFFGIGSGIALLLHFARIK